MGKSNYGWVGGRGQAVTRGIEKSVFPFGMLSFDVWHIFFSELARSCSIR